MKLNDLVQHIPHTGASDAEISAITYDSRKAAAGSLFVCLVGAWLDGHTYAASAYKNGCRAFLCEHALDLPADAAQIITADTRAALAVIGADFYGNPADQLHIIGITGTKGKTTTALLTSAIMTEAGLPCAYIGSNGVDIAGCHEDAGKPGAAPAVPQNAGRQRAPCGAGSEQPGPAPQPRGRHPL